MAIAVATLAFAESCIVPNPRNAVLFFYDSVRNVTLLRSPREVVEIRQPAPGQEPAELRAEIFYECPGRDTNCLPLGLRIRWTLIVYRNSHQVGGDIAKMNAQRFRIGDNITVVGKQWNMTFMVDSVTSNESRNMFFQGNNAYENIELTTYFYCSARADRILTISNTPSFTVTLAGRQIFYKSGGLWKNTAEFCRRAQSKAHR
ncbi:hypothetical protein MASR2M18_08390 [Ignavibacteria bacterium]